MPHNLEIFIDELSLYGALNNEDRESILMLPTMVHRVKKVVHLAQQGDVGDSLLLLTSGYALQQKNAGNGNRQISALNVRGDLLNLPSLFLARFDSDVVALKNSEITFIPKLEFLTLFRKRPAIAYALFRMTLVDACLVRGQLLNLARRDARTRIAHFLCHHAERMGARGLMSSDSFDMPLTQAQIGNATGLTAVHVNRMLKSLVDDGLISHNGSSIYIANREKFMAAGDYYPQDLY